MNVYLRMWVGSQQDKESIVAPDELEQSSIKERTGSCCRDHTKIRNRRPAATDLTGV